ncbi:uncharacterized protein [Nicotiana tomentosiformis]|uniref:uncharacterized protein n=1 Tax=Nicotiana tomentosiformis TaxID=4098 RepID=UPI00388CC42E
MGFWIPNWTDPLSNLSYTDDTIIFSSTHPDSFKKVMAILGSYEKKSSHLINKSKSSYYMDANIANALFQAVADATGFSKGEFPFTYLGYPTFYTRRSKDYYKDLIKKVKAKLHSWKDKLLSYGGKTTLITSALQSMPLHLLSVLDPPNNVIKHLHKLFARFVWSIIEEGRSRHWSSWHNLCLPKDEGELGFRSLVDVSKALHNVHFDTSDDYSDKPWWMPTTSGYKTIHVTRRVTWKIPHVGWYKCNIDGASRGNPGPSSFGFCIRDSVGDFVYARTQIIEETINIVAEARAIVEGLAYCVEKELHPLIIETDSLVMKKIIEGECTTTFSTFYELPSAKRRFLNIDKALICNLRVRIAKRRAPD